MLVLFGLLLTALVLMSNATQNSARFGELYSWLLISSAAGLLILALMIAHNLYRLIMQYRLQAPGAALTLRLVIVFVMISLTPVMVVYYFSIQFLQRGIDSWFDVRVEKSLEDALELSRASLDLRMREILKQTKRMAEDLHGVNDRLAAFVLNDMLVESDATELTLFGRSGRIIATSSIDQSAIIPNRPPDVVLRHVRQGHSYVSLDPIGNLGFHVRAVVQVPDHNSRGGVRIFQALMEIPQRLSLLADSVQSGYDSYLGLIYLRAPLKNSFTLTLSLVLVFGIMVSFWIAVYSARRLVKPLQDLANGTEAVAAGEYDQKLSLSSNDELGFLVQSFNEMTYRLAQAREANLRSQQLVERQRAYLEIVLARLSSGVLTLDHNGNLRTCNTAASQILNADLNALVGNTIMHNTEDEQLRNFFESINPLLVSGKDDWRKELTLFSKTGRRVLMCRGSLLPDSVGLKGGHVIVFDDITTLVQAERDAAWAEVARRLAHEIKNPLTPIQLSAERIRHKYLKSMDTDSGRVLDRATHTIIQQVRAMKDMVDAFNEYARPPQLSLNEVNLNEFIAEVMYLYRDYPAGIEIHLELDADEPMIKADLGRLRQLIHNLVKNAIEAIKDGQGSKLEIHTRCTRENNTQFVELFFQDDGPGFPESVIGNIFEPYVTTKPKGTGLGLAIVKKIVEEHGGLINLQSPEQGGACIAIRFPSNTATPETSTAADVSIVLANTEEAR